MSRPDRPRIFAKTAKFLWNLENVPDARKIQAAGEVTDKADAAQSDHYPEDYMKSFTDAPSLNQVLVIDNEYRRVRYVLGRRK